MNKTLFLTLAAALCLAGCGSKSDKPALAGDTVLQATQTAPSAEAAAPDVRLHDLKGPVKSLELYYDETSTDWCFRATFSQQGEWLTTNDGTPLKEFFNNGIERDSEGRLTALHRAVASTCEIEDDSYTYDTEGRLASAKYSDGSATTTEYYTYSPEGTVTEMRCDTEDAEEGNSSTTTAYRILETDSHGNWTRREASSGEGAKYVSKRVITYWK